MPFRFRIWLFGMMIFFSYSPISLWADSYIYTDDPQENEADTEYLDAAGKPIKKFEYEAKYRKEAKELQEEASAPFGKAGSGFGKERLKAAEIRPINEQAFEKSGSKEKNQEEEVPEALPPKKTAPEKPKVLVA